MVKELQAVGLGFLVVVVRPLLVVVDAHPCLVLGQRPPRPEGAHGVQGVGVAGHKIHRDVDVLRVGALILPQRMVRKGVLQALGADVLPPSALARVDMVELEPLVEVDIHHAAAGQQVAVGVAQALVGVDAGQMLRLLRRDEPLGKGQIAGAGQGHLAVGPLLHTQPLDQVAAVPRFERAQQVDVALGVGDAAGIGVADRVAVLAPVGGVRTLKLVQAGEPLVWDANHPKQVRIARRGAGALAVGAPGDQDRDLFLTRRAVDVRVDRHAVTQLHGHVLFQDDVAGHGLEPLVDLLAFFEKARARLKFAQDAVDDAVVNVLIRRFELQQFFQISHEIYLLSFFTQIHPLRAPFCAEYTTVDASCPIPVLHGIWS